MKINSTNQPSTINEEPFYFKNRNNHTLYGIAHIPSSSIKKTGIILFPAGIVQRSGPHNLYVTLARHLAKSGYHVFRIDTSGIGYSDNKLTNTPINELYYSIENGMFVNDSIDTVLFLKEEYLLNKIIIGGLCGGAITSILIANTNSIKIDGLLLLGTNILFEVINTQKNVNKYVAKQTLSLYFKRFFDISSWKSLLTGKSDYKLLYSSVITFITNIFIFKENNGYDPNFNHSLLKEFKKFNSRNKSLFIFGERDKYLLEFKSEFENKYLNNNNLDLNNFETYIIENSNHTFSDKSWKQQLSEKCIEWLNTCF